MKTINTRRLIATFAAGVMTVWLAQAGYAQTGSSTYTQKDKPLVQPGANPAEARTPDPASMTAQPGASKATSGVKGVATQSHKSSQQRATEARQPHHSNGGNGQ